MFQKGHAKKGGRQKGTTNKSTTKIRNAFAKLLDDNLPRLKEDLDSLDPKDRVKLMLDLSKYVIPQLKSTEHKLDEDSMAVFSMTVKDFFGLDETE